MFTILFLIRSFQGVADGSDINLWQDDWFLSTIITILMVVVDLFIITVIYNFI